MAVVYVQTTGFILIWCLLLSLLIGVGSYYFSAGKTRKVNMVRLSVPLPVLVLSPIVIWVGFRWFGVSLLFPIGFDGGVLSFFASALAPALVLVISCGLATSVQSAVESEYSLWRAKPFVTVAQAMGQHPAPVIRRIVLAKALSESWARCLPWLFGELVVIESLFAAPGLGLGAWHMARARDYYGLTEFLVLLILLYGACVFCAALINDRLGKRLEGYV